MILKGKAGMRVKSGETISVTYSNDLITVGDVPCIIWFYIDAMKRRRARENLRLVKQGNTKGLLRTIQRRFINAGLQSCSDEEVIELLLGITLPESLASKLASESISEFHSLSKFLESPVDRWESLGIPYKAALSLLLIQEVPERVLKQKVMAQPTYNSPQQIVDYLYYSLRNAKKEVLKVIHLNNQGQIEDIMDLFEGSVDRISFNLREAIENAIARKAKSLVFIHNHPTGDPTPSKTDKQLTRDLVFIGNILQIRVLDHIIVGDNRYFSFADEGLIEEYETDFLNLKLSVTHEAKYRLEQARTFANVHRVLTRKSTPVFLKLQ
jgi:DNA repair protein RadC